MLVTSVKSCFSPSDLKALPHLGKLVPFVLLLLLLFSWINILPASLHHLPSFLTPPNPIYNSTLGFEQIYVLALKSREDRIKPLLQAANATGLNLTVLNAVRDNDIPQESWPTGWEAKNHQVGQLGCLTSHVRTWNQMITDNIATALILESDADWDMRVKAIFAQLPPAIKKIVDWPFNKPLHKKDPFLFPYGDSWDIIWMGHCGSSMGGLGRIYSWNDSSVPPEDKEFIYDVGLNQEQHIPGTRALFQFGRTTCSTGYAISLEGAKKLVPFFKEAGRNLDLQLSSLCTSRPTLTCLGVWPQIITAAETESNIAYDGRPISDEDAKEEGDVKAGPGLQFSARVNAERVLRGSAGKGDWVAEWETMWGVGEDGTWGLLELNRALV